MENKVITNIIKFLPLSGKNINMFKPGSETLTGVVYVKSIN